MNVEDVRRYEHKAQDERDKAARSQDICAARKDVELAQKFEQRARGETSHSTEVVP
jgi:hypothetical protein